MRFVFALLILVCSAGATQAEVAFEPHRAVYELDRIDEDPKQAFSDISGRMVYEYDKTCDGVAYSHRLVMNLVTQEGMAFVSETVVSFFESSDRRTMRFQVRESYDNQVISVQEGTVSRPSPDAPAKVTYTRYEGSDKKQVEELPSGTLFPLHHSVDLLKAAAAGKAMHHAVTFDGEELSLVDSFIQPDSGKWEKAVPKVMEGMKAWITHVSFFDPDKPDAAPYYESRMRVFENGLSGDFTMETEDLSAIARLTKVELFDPGEC